MRSPSELSEASHTHKSEFLKRTQFWQSVHTHGDEGLVEAIEAEVPDEPAATERRNVPQVEVRDHQERSATHHPVEDKWQCVR